MTERVPEHPDYKTTVEVARARYKLACDEMDRLTAGNPGTNWRWSIPANPERDSDLILSASADDVPRLADAVEALLAENEKLRENRGWDGEWRTPYQTEEEARRVLMHWTKAQLVNHHVAEWQRRVQNENWVADRLAKMTAERDELQAQIDKLRAVLTDPPLRPATERVMKATRLLNHPDWKEWK